MGTFPQDSSLTQQVLEAADIVQVISQYVNLRQAGKDLKGLCPFHDDRHPSMTVSPSKQIFKCFACGAGGDAIKFIQLKEKMSFLEARAMLADRVGVRLEVSRSPGGATFRSQRMDLAKLNAWAAEFFRASLHGPQGQVAREYIERRAITRESSETFQIGFAPDTWDSLLISAHRSGIDKNLLFDAGLVKKRESGNGFYDTFRNRVMFPILDTSGNVVAFGGRALDDNPAKYLNSPESAVFSKGKTLFGLNLAREQAPKAKRILVVEGYMDCLACHQSGYSEAVAVLGTALTDVHVQMLRRYVDSVVLVFDGDEAGIKAADRSIEIVLNGQLDVRLAILPGGNDPADLLMDGQREVFEAALAGAVDALEFRWQRFQREFGADEGSGPARKKATDAFLEFLAQMPTLHAGDALQRGMWAVRAGQILGLEPREIQQALRRFQRTAFAGGAGPATPVSAADKPKADPEQAALRQIVEVLLNEPAYYDVAREILQAQPIADADLAEVARQLRDLCESGRPWGLTDLLAQLPDARFGALVTDLQMAAQERGNFDGTLDGALACLQHAAFLREASRTAEQAKSAERTGAVQPDSSSVDENLRKLTEDAGKHRHFAPPKWLS
jgi:DNA primase